jgi:hypothetical protein
MMMMMDDGDDFLEYFNLRTSTNEEEVRDDRRFVKKCHDWECPNGTRSLFTERGHGSLLR